MSLSPDRPSVVTSDLTFSWPDGTPVFDGLAAAFTTGRTGLVGTNGSGKSTLLALIAGKRPPARGSVTVTGTLAFLPQDMALRSNETVAEALGIDRSREALRRIESGTAFDEDFGEVDWDVEERTLALLSRVGLARISSTAPELDRVIPTLSGGESTLLGLLSRILVRPDVLLLDEPTNNLDARARSIVYDVLDRFAGTVIVASHDRELLDRMDSITEVRREGAPGGPATVRSFGGNYTAYTEQIEAEQISARAAVRDATRDVRRQARELAETHTKLGHRKRYGQKMFEQKREPKIVMGNRKRAAQESAGKLRIEHEQHLAAARDELSATKNFLRDDREIRVDLPDTRVHPGRRVIEGKKVPLDCGGRFPGRTVSLEVVGSERVALVGDNGVGKSTLLDSLDPLVPSAYLRQRLDVFDEEASLLENVTARAPHSGTEQLRARLARFLFRGSSVDAPVRTLSGGERLRAALATVLLADPPPQLLLLDEPTNNLDLASVRHLTEALTEFEGALVVVSHDERFLRDIGVTKRVELE